MMGLKMNILASGSTGNAMVVCGKEVRLLVDAGLSARKIEQLLASQGMSGDELDGILVTHEHSDHIKGLGPFARKYRLKVYANAGTWRAMEGQIGELEEDQKRVFETGSPLDFGLLRAESFAISHDAVEPVGFCFYEGDSKLSIATDLGYISANVREKIADSDVLVLEANHDVEMLRVGRQGIVTFPNFGYWRLRLQLALKGRMPMSEALPHMWYDTPNIRLFTLRDFEALCHELGIRILERYVLDHAHRRRAWSDLLPNLLGEIAIYRFERR